jgi:GABA permease
MWLFPWLSILALLGMTTVLLAMAFTPGMQTDFKASCITVLLSLAAYTLVRWRRGARTAGG